MYFPLSSKGAVWKIENCYKVNLVSFLFLSTYSKRWKYYFCVSALHYIRTKPYAMYIAICMSCVGVSKEQNITIFGRFTSFNSNDDLPYVTVCRVQLIILPYLWWNISTHCLKSVFYSCFGYNSTPKFL